MFKREGNRFYLGEDPRNAQAKIDFTQPRPDEYRITHTYVDPSLRGQSMGARLVDAVAELARQENKKVSASCSYALKLLETRSEYADISLHR